MILLLIILALAFPVVEGVLALRLIEGGSPVLWRAERWCAGFLFGCTLSGFLIFWGVLFGVPLTFAGFLGMHVVMISGLSLVCRRKFKILNFKFKNNFKCDNFSKILNFLRLFKKYPLWLRALLFWMIVWTILKIVAGGYDIFNVPSYWDDNYANWNMRSQVMYTEENLMLHLPSDNSLYFGGRAAGYPLTVYFTKIWLAQFTETLCRVPSLCENAGFKDPVVNSVSFFWFVAFLVIFFCGILRTTKNNPAWAIFGVYLLVSIPLFLVHGTNPYSDVLMAGHLFMALYFFWEWVRQKSLSVNSTWLRLLAFAAAMMIYVKNEALLIFLPPFLLIFVWVCWKRIPDMIDRIKAMVIVGASVAFVAIPWSFFKMTHDLGFANNKSVGGVLSLTPDPNVPLAIFNDLMYTGSFLILFPLFVLLLAISWSVWRRSEIALLVTFLLVVFAGEFCIYWFTDLATEAVRHTGFGRGMIHIVPVIVFVSVVLLRELFGEKNRR